MNARIAIIGSGRIALQVAALARATGHDVVTCLDLRSGPSMTESMVALGTLVPAAPAERYRNDRPYLKRKKGRA